MESKYLNRFQRTAASGGFDGLRGDRIFVEVLPKEELRSKGGLVIATDLKNIRSDTAENRPTLAVVLAIGSGYVDGDGDAVSIDLKPGNVVLVSQMGLKLFSEFPGLNDFVSNTIALTRECEVHMSWESIDAYQAYREVLNAEK